MARKGRIFRVRTYLRWFAKSGVEAIDRFRAHVHDAAAAERRSSQRFTLCVGRERYVRRTSNHFEANAS